MVQLYPLLKTIHITGVVLFIGNIIVTGWWKVMANQTRDPRVIAFAQRQVTLTDYVFTLGGVLILGIAGASNAFLHQMPVTEGWILTGLILFSASGIVWGMVLIPVQIIQHRLSRAFALADDASVIPAVYWRNEKIWIVAGTLSTLLAVAAIPVMVYKG